MLGDQLAHQRPDAADKLLLAMAAVREERIVRDIDIARIRPAAHDLAGDGQAAKAGVEDEDEGSGGHGV